MELLKKRVVYWSKLATLGARPVAEKAGLARETFARVLNARRELREDETEALAEVLALGREGFLGNRIESNLCRFLSDLAALQEVGIDVRVIAHLRSTKEIRGGAPLQRYCLAVATAGNTQRLMVMRMATKKFDEFLQALKQPELAVVEFDTVVLPLMNEIQYEIADDDWKEFSELFNGNRMNLKGRPVSGESDQGNVDVSEHSQLAKWIGRTLKKALRDTEVGQTNPSIVRRVRSSGVLRLAKDRNVLALWPSGAREYAKRRVLIPLTNEFQPFHAAATLGNKRPVFVHMTLYSSERGLFIPDGVSDLRGHVLVFNADHPADSNTDNVLFDGDAQKLCLWMKDVQFESLDPELDQVRMLMRLNEEIPLEMKVCVRETATVTG